MTAGRVLFHYPVLKMGGAEMSSLRMMTALADRGWRITLVLTTGGGALEPMVDPRIEVVRLRPRPAGGRFAAARGIKARFGAVSDLIAYGAMRAIGGLRMIPFLFRRYDAAVVLLMGLSSAFIRWVVHAPVRIIWIRNDLMHADPSGRIRADLRAVAPQIDRFLCVSGTVRRSLVSALPELADKAEVIYNILEPSRMRSLAAEGSAPFATGPDGYLRILSVCRLSDRAKGLFRMVRVASRLAAAGHLYRWYIAGDGPDRHALQAAIQKAGLADRMILLGALANPFPAYAAADIVAMLSYYEGLCGVVNEARVLEKPIIATQVSGIDEQLTDGVNGLIVPQDEDAIVRGLERLLADNDLRARLAAGGYPGALLDDDTKLDRLEELFRQARGISAPIFH